MTNLTRMSKGSKPSCFTLPHTSQWKSSRHCVVGPLAKLPKLQRCSALPCTDLFIVRVLFIEKCLAKKNVYYLSYTDLWFAIKVLSRSHLAAPASHFQGFQCHVMLLLHGNGNTGRNHRVGWEWQMALLVLLQAFAEFVQSSQEPWVAT